MFLKEPGKYRIKEYTIPFFSDHDKKPVVVALIGDLHISPIVSDKRIEKVSTLLKKIKPDLIVLHGDLIDVAEFLLDESLRKKLLTELKNCVTVAPTIAVSGNHDLFIGKKEAKRLGVKRPHSPNWAEQEFENAMKEANVRFLKDEWFEFRGIRFFGFFQDTDCLSNEKKQLDNIPEMRKKIERLSKKGVLKTNPETVNWFVSHVPIGDIVRMKELRGFEVFSFGHMHGGLMPIGIDRVVDKLGWRGGLIGPHKELLPGRQMRGIETLPNRAKVIVTTGVSGISSTAPKALQNLNFLKAAEITKVTVK